MRLAWAVSLLALLGCSPSPRIIAREDAAPLGVAGAAGAGAGNDGAAGGVGGEGAVAGPRGRVRVEQGELVSDIGTRLRGVLLPVDTGWVLGEPADIHAIAQRAGLNTLHVYLENYQQPSGENLALADELVDLAEAAGLYVILGIGGGDDNGNFYAEKVQSFWELYGPRYADRTHVLYEIQNNPELTCDQFVEPATLALEQQYYEYLRSVAPETHLVLFSGSSIVQPAVLSDLLERLAPFADFDNVSLALHTDIECTPLADFETVQVPARAAGAALLISQLPDTGWDPYVRAFEAAGVGWMQYRYFARELPIHDFISDVTEVGLSWCPDFGTFPEDASGCRP